MASELSTQVQDFIMRYMDSVEEMEILFLLLKSKDKWWNSPSVYHEIRSSPASVTQRLEGLVGKGLVVRKVEGENLFQYGPATAELDNSVEALASAYSERLIRVLECLYSKPLNSLKNFADAFRIRKDDTNG
jgi:hypothetical protein